MTMTEYVGIDWTSGRWLAVALSGDSDADIESRVYPSVLSAWRAHREAEAIFIDVPIGLPTDRPRECDRLAREFVHPDRAGSVFQTPSRAALTAFPHATASERNRDAIGNGISAQCWGIVPCIRAVDDLLQETPEARSPTSDGVTYGPGRLREAHPEVCFAAIAPDDTPITTDKTTEAGRQQRIAALNTLLADARGAYETVLDHQLEQPKQFSRRLRSGDRDDVLDALVLAASARESAGHPQTLPESPPTDDTGLPMEICYWSPDHDSER